MTILTCKNITKSFGVTKILDDISFNIKSGDKVGLVGVNGAGKSTLFNIITGETQHDEGEIYISKSVKIGYLKQNYVFNSENTIYDELLEVFKEVIILEKEIKEIEKRIEIEEDNTLLNVLVEKHNKLLEEFKVKNGYGFNSLITGVLKGLGYDENEFNNKICTLSGGQKTRVALAKLLLEDPEIILLDEPTNHLDLNAIEWLEKYLSNLNKSFIAISHDRYFLDKVTNRTILLENNIIKEYKGNYSYYVKNNKKERTIENKKYNQQVKEIQRIEGIIKQQKQWNRERNIKMAESKMKTVDMLNRQLNKPETLPNSIRFEFNTTVRSANDVLEIKNLTKYYGKKKLFKNLDVTIKRGEKVFVLGENGTGKSTIFKILMGDVTQTEGVYKFGSNVICAYYEQEQSSLNFNKTAIDEIWDDFPDKTETEIRNSLAAFNFRGDDIYKKVSELSGGEKARIILIKIMLSKANFLLLDEPTNHLDINSREVLETALGKYDGTLLIISHDRYFINKTASKILELKNETIDEYLGNYDYMSEKKSQLTEDNISEKKTNHTISDGKEKYIKHKEKIADVRKAKRDFEKLEKKITLLEDELKSLKKELFSEETSLDYKKSMDISEKIKDIEAELESKYEKWIEISSKI